MNQDFDNQPQKSNRFIFSDEFYDQLDSAPEEEKVSFDVPKMSSQTIPESMQEEKIDNGIASNEKQSIKQNDLVSLVKKRDIEKIEKNVNINYLDSQNSRIKHIFQKYNNHESESNNDEIEEEDKSEESGQDNGHMSYEESKRHFL